MERKINYALAGLNAGCALVSSCMTEYFFSSGDSSRAYLNLFFAGFNFFGAIFNFSFATGLICPEGELEGKINDITRK